MIRKQLNIDALQEDALKRIAAERGISESEVVREAIERFVDSEQTERERGLKAAAVLDELFSDWDGIPFESPARSSHRFGLYDAE